MAKDRNTFAKRQREVEQKRKAGEKRERRSKKKQKTDEVCEPTESQALLSPEEHTLLSVFRKYLMTPGKMLCLGSSDLAALNMPLAELTKKGLLVPERFPGGISLTKTGFAAMKGVE